MCFFKTAAVTNVAVSSMAALLLGSCTFGSKGEPGSKSNPIQLFFTPSVDSKSIDASGKQIEEFLQRATPYQFSVKVPQSYIAVVEAFGAKRADIAVLNTFGYLLANEKYGVEARLMVIRNGLATYQAQILARANDHFKSIKDLAGKKFAYVDPASMSGYLLPFKMFQDEGIKLGETVFAMKHDSVVSMIYQGQVDAGATFYSPPEKGEIQDARRLVKTQYPDVEDKIKILKLTSEIPNDPIAFRKDLPEEIKKKIIEALVKYVRTPAGREAFNQLYLVTDLKPALDTDYDGVRAMLKSIGKSPAEFAK